VPGDSGSDSHRAARDHQRRAWAPAVRVDPPTLGAAGDRGDRAVSGGAAGVFFLRTEKGDPQLRPDDVAFANTIAQAAARVLENEERRSAIYRRQISAGATDEMTGCASLDALDRRLRDEFERARRYSLRFSLVLVDIDHLREINDRLGHPAGDRVLGEVGAILQREIRAPDFVARYGGDEF